MIVDKIEENTSPDFKKLAYSHKEILANSTLIPSSDAMNQKYELRVKHYTAENEQLIKLNAKLQKENEYLIKRGKEQ